MSEIVCCPLSGGEDGAEFQSDKQVKARKAHKCCECHEVIPVGTVYEYSSGRWDDDFSVYKTCLSCVEIRNHFACNGWTYGCLWEDLETNFFENMAAGGPCMEGLSPEAKARLFDRRMRWYEEQAE